MNNERNGLNEKLMEVGMFSDYLKHLVFSEKVLKDLQIESEQMSEKAGLKRSLAKCHIITTANRGRADKSELDDKGTNITTSPIYLRVEATKRGVSEK